MWNRQHQPLLAKAGVSVAVANLEIGDIVLGYEADEADALKPLTLKQTSNPTHFGRLA